MHIRCRKRTAATRNSQEKYEQCVICNCRTNVLKTMPIDARPDYVDGAGQLCQVCYKELEPEFRASDEKIRDKILPVKQKG